MCLCWCAPQVWDRKDCVTFVCAGLKGRLQMAQAESRPTIVEDAPKVGSFGHPPYAAAPSLSIAEAQPVSWRSCSTGPCRALTMLL